jgi:DNA-binding transcriptional MerR regulator
MKTGEAAKILGIDKATIYNWTAHPLLERFFSLEAKSKIAGTQRLLTESDVLVLNTIRTLRGSGKNDWGEIAAVLESGHRVQEFPQNAISSDPRVIPLPQAKQAAEVLAMRTERDAALQRVDELERRLADAQRQLDERLKEERAEMDAKYEKRLEEERLRNKAALDEEKRRNREEVLQNKADIERLLREIGELRYKIGQLEKRDGKAE